MLVFYQTGISRDRRTVPQNFNWCEKGASAIGRAHLLFVSINRLIQLPYVAVASDLEFLAYATLPALLGVRFVPATRDIYVGS